MCIYIKYKGVFIMSFAPNTELQKYDVFPLVFAAGKEVEINIRPLGSDPDFAPGA